MDAPGRHRGRRTNRVARSILTSPASAPGTSSQAGESSSTSLTAWRGATSPAKSRLPTPISARLYTEYGFPWFDRYDEGKGDIEGSDVLGGVKTDKELDDDKGFGEQQDDCTVDVPQGQVKTIKDVPPVRR